MDYSRTLTDNSVGLARNAGDSLTEIARTVSVIQEMNPQIAAAAEQQSAVVEEINRNVEQINQFTQETTVIADQLNDASTNLQNLSRQLDDLVGNFKL